MKKRHSGHRRPLNERLSDKPGRDKLPAPKQVIPESAAVLRTDKRDEIAAVAVGMLVLSKVREFGQTALFERSIEQVLKSATRSLTPEEVMNLEVEAYEVLDYLVGGPAVDADDKDAVASRAGDIVYYDPHASFSAIIERAIDENFDLKIDYFSLKRASMNTRRITPHSIEAETYVRAYCHQRRGNRVFRLNRITRCIPINGRPRQRIVLEPDPAPPTEPSRMTAPPPPDAPQGRLPIDRDTPASRGTGAPPTTSRRPKRQTQDQPAPEPVQISLLGDDEG